MATEPLHRLSFPFFSPSLDWSYTISSCFSCSSTLASFQHWLRICFLPAKAPCTYCSHSLECFYTTHSFHLVSAYSFISSSVTFSRSFPLPVPSLARVHLLCIFIKACFFFSECQFSLNIQCLSSSLDCKVYESRNHVYF